MKTKVLNIAVIENSGRILMRKKLAGSPPYDETWYIFGGEVAGEADPEQATKEIVKKQSGIDIRLNKNIGWDTEMKRDVDGEEKQFIYLDSLFDYAGGDIVVGDGIEEIKWVPIEELALYDLVPPSRKLFERMGYIASVSKENTR